MLLQLALATGMRLGEIALLTWERVKSTNKCSFISLLDEGDEIVTAKNQGSKRRIPLHPDLKLPPKGNGRIFDYAIDGYGKATTAAGSANATAQAGRTHHHVIYTQASLVKAASAAGVC